MSKGRILFFFILFLYPSWNQTFGLCLKGRIVEGGSGRPVANALVQVLHENRSLLCDTLGRFELCDLKNRNCEIKVSHASYKPKTVRVRPTLEEFLLIEMEERVVETKEVVVYGDHHYSLNAAMPGMETVGQKDIQNIPAFLGEKDVLKAIQALPGVQSVSEGNGGIFVRGGGNGQNLFLLDEMEIMNPSHIMGIYSVFNPLTTDKAELFKGSAPVYLQGRLASTILVSTKNPLLEHSGIEANIGNISSTISLDKTSADGKVGIIMGYRRSYLDGLGWMSSLFIPDEKNYFKKYGYNFYDFNGRIQLKLSDQASISAGWYTGKDVFSLNNADLMYRASSNWKNQAFDITYRKSSENGSVFRHSVSYSSTSSLFDGEIIENDIYLKSVFSNWQQKNQWFHSWSHHDVHAGLDFFYQKTMPMDLKYYYMDESFDRKAQYRNEGATMYAGDHFKLSERSEIYFGLRSTVDLAKDSTYRKIHFSVSPVISFSIHPNTECAYKASYSANSQHLHLASFSSIPLPNDIWVSSSPKIKPEKAHQLTVGYYRTFNAYDFSAEIFGKYMLNQLLFGFVTNSADYTDFEDQFMVGKGMAYGIDLSLEKNEGLFTGFVNYSLSRSKRSFPKIESGHWFNDKYDRPHDLSVNVAYHVNERWDVSALWTFASGVNLTLPTGRYWLMGSVMNDYEGYNSFRLPSYHRLDLSASLRLKPKHFKESVLNFSIINAYNRANPYYAFFKVLTGETRYEIKIKSMQVSLFPIMPSVSWRFKI